jgi:hypothetical protein
MVLTAQSNQEGDNDSTRPEVQPCQPPADGSPFIPAPLLGSGKSQSGTVYDEMAVSVACSRPADKCPVSDDSLKKLLMSWYYAGYYTGLYEGQKQSTKQ